ncbi:MAG: sensor histidine kinase [Alphaproteobacteria bacterium]
MILPSAPRIEGQAGSIASFALKVRPISRTTSCGQAYELFVNDDSLLAVPVVAGERPVGLLYRHDLTQQLAHGYGRALFERKPVSKLMDPDPLIVDRSVGIEQLQSLIVVEKQSALLRGFIITEGGRYLAMGTALALLRLVMLDTERRNVALEVERRRAEEASLSKSRFLAQMSHELRTPLNAIIGFSDVLRHQMFGPLSERYLGYATDIHTSGQHLLSIINDILDLAKIEAGRFDLHDNTELSLKAACNEVTRMMHERAEAAGLRFDIELERGLPPLRADARAFRQMLLNLLSNAIKFTPPGGSLHLFARLCGDGRLAVGVRDTGIGIAPADLPTALTPFGQISSELSRRYEGTGLGLPLVKSLVELHGGELKIDSAPCQGTTATILFPASRVVGEAAHGPLAVSTGR